MSRQTAWKARGATFFRFPYNRPDTRAAYSRLLPLDLNDDVYTTKYNGLRKEDIEGAEHLTQDEADRLFDEFEIDKRTVLHYGNPDVRFVRDYFARHNIKGFLRMRFYNVRSAGGKRTRLQR